MQKKDCFLVGTVFKLHGYKGDVNIYNDDDILFDFSELDYFLIEQKNELIPYFILRARPTKPNVVLVSFENVDSEKEALKILKRKVYLPKDWLPETDENEITEKKLIGLSVIDKKFGNLGKVAYINSQSAQQLIYAEKNGKEFCFPFHDQFVKRIDIKKGIMEVEIPKELIDLN
ncbi:MAG: 16S rRNA processing protein RimM [Flavobacteriales bacterium]|nr:16S rRNA processing protein RimM [Flavobacteriales bacterium]